MRRRDEAGGPADLPGSAESAAGGEVGSAFETETLRLLADAIERLANGFAGLPAGPWACGPVAAEGAAGDVKPAAIEPAALRRVLFEVAARMTDNYPYFHPLYAGQMLKPPHPMARLAAMLAIYLNPNNHALDGGRASSRLEKEAVAELAAMVGWTSFLGHLTSAGTTANLEALWVAGCLHPDRCIVGSEQAHYTHQRISGVLRLPYEAIPCDRTARLDLAALERRLAAGGVGTVVATIGTTATGSVDPLPELLELRRRYGFRIHADAAYGGYFGLVEGPPPAGPDSGGCTVAGLAPATRRGFDRLGEVDSLVIDPHKHGLQPYGCGCVLFRDPSVGRFYRHDSPYTYFSSDELHLGEISLECSRAGAAAVALWATQRLLPLARGGEFAGRLAASLAAARDLHARLAADDRFLPAFPPELDIVCWIPRADRVSRASELARRIFAEAERRHLYLALADLPIRFFDLAAAGMDADRDTVTSLRSVLMKPEHRAWLPTLWRLLDEATRAATMDGAGRVRDG